jgi:hypothetical protein
MNSPLSGADDSAAIALHNFDQDTRGNQKAAVW